MWHPRWTRWTRWVAAATWAGRRCDLQPPMNSSWLLEHRLQFASDSNATICWLAFDDDEALRWLARAATFRPQRAPRCARSAARRTETSQPAGSRLHAKLFYQPLLESIGPGRAWSLSWHDHPPPPTTAARARLYTGRRARLPHPGRVDSTRAGPSRTGSRRCCCQACWMVVGHATTRTPVAAYRRVSEVLTPERWYLATLA